MVKQATLIFVPVKTLKESKRFVKYSDSGEITRLGIAFGGGVPMPHVPVKLILIGKDGTTISDDLKPRQIEKIIKNNYHCKYEIVDDKLKIII